jgi:hypothetical protein
MPYQVLCNGVKREGVKASPNLASELFSYVPLHKNPDTDFIVRDEGKLAGFINMLPVKVETIKRFMHGEIRGWEIPADDVLPYTPGSTLECIVMGMATTPKTEKQRRTLYGAKLINGLLDLDRKSVV